jgi:hypothetical protein
MTNRDEFVPLVIDAIAELDDANGQLRRRTVLEQSVAREFVDKTLKQGR